MKKYIIAVGEKFVSSPTDKLTDNKELAGVFDDSNIDAVFGYWDKQSNGNAEILEQCGLCGEYFSIEEMKEERDLGLICERCILGAWSRGEKLYLEF